MEYICICADRGGGPRVPKDDLLFLLPRFFYIDRFWVYRIFHALFFVKFWKSYRSSSAFRVFMKRILIDDREVGICY